MLTSPAPGCYASAMAAAQLLLVEDDPQIVRALVPALEVCGHAVTVASDGMSALCQLAAGHWDALVVDLGLPDMDGKAIVRRLRETGRTPVIVISARDAMSDEVECRCAGADHFLRKPFATPELIGCVESAIDAAQGANGV